MPKMTTCPKSHFVQGDKLSLRRYHLCLSLQNAYKFGQKLANFQVQTHHYFFVIKKPINFSQICRRIRMPDFRPEKASQAFGANFHLRHEIFGKISCLANCHIEHRGNMLPWALCLWAF